MLATILKYHLFSHCQHTPPLPEGVDWNVLMSEAKIQAVEALLYDAIKAMELSIPREILFQLSSNVATIESDNRKREQALSDLAYLANKEAGLFLTVVKGSSLARLYPNPIHRECGDNDLYMGSSATSLDCLVASHGLEVDQKDPRHSSFIFHGVVFENHAYLLYPSTPGDTSSEPEWKKESHQQNIKRLTPPYEALFVAAHMEHHAVFHNESINLRKLIDWSLLLGVLDYEEFNKVKQGTDMERFADLLTQYCIQLFDLPAPKGYTPLSEKSLEAFPYLYLYEQKRSSWSFIRVYRRSMKYLRYSRVYKEIYGQSPFRRFYFRNVGNAIRQLLTGQKRTVRQ